MKKHTLTLLLLLMLGGCVSNADQQSSILHPLSSPLTPASAIPPLPAPIPTFIQIDNGWHIEFTVGSFPTNYIWTIQSTTNLASGNWQEEEVSWDGDAAIYYPCGRLNLQFRLLGATNSPAKP